MIPIRKNRPHRGMLAIAVLVCLLIVIAIAGTLIRAATAQRDEARAVERRLQAEWLAEAGLQRAIARLATALRREHPGQRTPPPAVRRDRSTGIAVRPSRATRP